MYLVMIAMAEGSATKMAMAPKIASREIGIVREHSDFTVSPDSAPMNKAYKMDELFTVFSFVEILWQVEELKSGLHLFKEFQQGLNTIKADI